MTVLSGGTQLLNAKEILQHEGGLAAGMVYAVLGVGSSAHFVFPGAEIVGPQGTVYAIDILKAVLTTTESRAQEARLNNIKTVWSDLEVYGAAKEIPDHSADVISMINLLYETKQDEHVFNEANRIVKKGGKAVIIDWLPIEASFGPPMEQRTSLDKVRQMAKVVHWKESHTFQPSPYHFGVVFEKE